MKQTVDQYTFTEAFKRLRPGNFSYAGLEVLFGYLEDLERDTGTEIELDVIAICCDWSESSLDEVRQDYEKPELNDDELLEYLVENTLVIQLDDDTVIYQAF